jgi:hypothetical protein
MTQLRCNRDSLSNLFDEWLRGIGHRGSSFCDIDAITHDETTHRYLIQEFKQAGEVVPDGQRRVLSDLAREPRVTVWIVRRLGADVLSWADALFWNDSDALISVAEYQDRFRAWWMNRYRVEDYAEISTDQFQRVEGRR